jgi:hypothetical protein
MSDLPERIWYIAYGDFRETPSDRADDVEYIRKDIADAAVKAERERCAKLAAARADYIDDAVLRGGSEGFIQSLKFARAELSDIAATIRKGEQP